MCFIETSGPVRRALTQLVYTALVLTFTGGSAMAQAGAGAVTGMVRDSSGAILPDVRLEIRGPDHQVETSGPNGRFVFKALPPGEYELTATLNGFAAHVRRVRLGDGESVELSLVLTLLIREVTVVTADRTGEREAQATPIAISVLPGSVLQQAQAHTIADLGGVAPSLTFSQNTGFAQLTIRGIGTNVVFAGSDPSSAVYLDGVYLARPAGVMGDFLELERVEVLRGPQGTLYGRNAVGGALNLVTKPPTNEFEASARLVTGSQDMLRSEARASGPIVRGRVLGSAAVLRGVRDGSVRDLDHLDHRLGGEDVTAGTAKLHFLFDPRADLLLSADLTHQDPTPLVYAKVLAVKPGFPVDNPADLHEVRTSTLARSRKLQHGASARFTWRFAPRTELTSLTAFRALDYDLLVDADITELPLTESNVHEIHRQWSQEITIASRGSRLTWVSGLFVFQDLDRQPTTVRFPAGGFDNHLDPRVSTRSGAVFGQARVALSDRWSATAGLRYTRERKAIDNSGRLVTLDLPMAVIAGTAYSYSDEISHTAWTPRFGLEARLDERGLAYVSATRGFKVGGFNLTSQRAGRGFAPEWAWSYEAGVKTSFADGRARLNLAVFQTDYTDLQVQTAILPGVIDISNAAEATIRGVELEAVTRLTPTFRSGGHVAWLDARFDRYIAVGVGGVTGDVAGRRLANAPQWSGRFWLEWNRRIRWPGLLTLRAETRWQGTVYFTPFNDGVQRQRPYGLLDASAEFGPRLGVWSIGLFGRNLTDADYITGSFSSPPPAIGGRPGDPRQAGIQLTLRP